MSTSALGRQFSGRANLRGDMTLGILAQQSRAEASTGGHKTEMQGFYGHSDRAQNSDGETRLTSSMADHEQAKRSRYEDSQAEAHASGTADDEPKSVKGFW
jgi:hypothetical protein